MGATMSTVGLAACTKEQRHVSKIRQTSVVVKLLVKLSWTHRTGTGEVDHAENENGLVTGVAATLGGVLLLIKETRSPRASIF